MTDMEFRSAAGTRHGPPYTLREFAEKYDLPDDRATDLYFRFGPSSIDLDLLMAAIRRVSSCPNGSPAK
jgi:hypothetical protein